MARETEGETYVPNNRSIYTRFFDAYCEAMKVPNQSFNRHAAMECLRAYIEMLQALIAADALSEQFIADLRADLRDVIVAGEQACNPNRRARRQNETAAELLRFVQEDLKTTARPTSRAA